MNHKRIIVYSIPQARAAIDAAAGRSFVLMSARDMAGFMGPLWFKALVEEAVAASSGANVTAALDCADEAGTTLGALRCGFKLVRFTGPEEQRARLNDIASQLGARVEGAVAAETLDLLDCKEPLATCRAFFG
jgi:hypothetical protein